MTEFIKHHRGFRAFVDIPGRINIALIFILFVVLSPGQAIESAPGQYLTGIITLSDGQTESSNFVVPAEIDMILDAAELPVRQQDLISLDVSGQWNITVKADNSTQGYMTEYNTSSSEYVVNGCRLSTPMYVWVDENNKIDLSDGGDGLIKSGEGPGTFIVYFEQGATWDDPVLLPGREYHMTVIFTLD